ncbi:MAG: DNA primase small subunit domain-containing protein [Candidatus Hodarchaeota archaeon]
MIEYLKTLFRAHYRGISLEKMIPSNFPNRELAFVLWNKKGMFRHQGFIEEKDYKDTLIKQVPRHVYYSAGLYNSPWRDKMEEKDYIGCDLVFDIDCDHIDTSCKEDHDTWTCTNCGKKGKGTPPKECKCGGSKFKEKNWLCDVCLEKSKTETMKLIDSFLTSDFGMNSDSITVFFSGHRGYHVHLEDESYRNLSSEERREISDYITATGIKLSTIGDIGFDLSNTSTRGFTSSDTGWRGKITKNLEILLDQVKKSPEKISLDKNIIDLLDKNHDELKDRIDKESRNWTIKGIGEGKWNRILDYLVLQARCEIDVPVTIDTHRLIRAPESLHGKTGFKVCKIDKENLAQFDPFSDPVVFKGNKEKIKALDDVPEFRIGDNRFGKYEKDQEIELPLEAAVFLLCRNMGVLI